MGFGQQASRSHSPDEPSPAYTTAKVLLRRRVRRGVGWGFEWCAAGGMNPQQPNRRDGAVARRLGVMQGELCDDSMYVRCKSPRGLDPACRVERLTDRAAVHLGAAFTP
jgi:hypothetical protein